MPDLFKHIGARIRELRTEYNNGQGLSQERIATALGVTTNTISRWETAAYHPGLEDLEKLAKFFGSTIMDFLPSTSRPGNVEVTEASVMGEKIGSLLDTVRQLAPEDVDEIQNYAEFKRARSLNGGTTRPRVGRKPKKT
jgi:transcriptional regulator with XRE-family HTH domain